MGYIAKSINRTLWAGFCITLIAVVCLITALPSSVSAASQAIFTGSNTPAGYLANPGGNAWGLEHMLDNAISSDVWTSTPGGYCNAYETGSALNQQSGTNQNSFTGFSTGTPYTAWQQGDSAQNNVCQAKDSTWGFKVSGASNNNCSPNIACGMHHFHRFGGDIRPWSGATPGTALTFEYKTRPKTVNLAGGGAAGYFCAVLRQVNTPYHIELCFNQWKFGSGFPNSNEPLVCADSQPQGYNIDTVWTTLSPNVNSWGTQRAGSANTLTSIPGNHVLQTGSISAQNLRNVTGRINAPQPTGCARGVSTNVADYQLVGFENGIEGGGFSLLGAYTQEEKLSKTSDALFTKIA